MALNRRHHAVVTNLEWDAVRLLQWHREQAGTIDRALEEVKNGLAAERRIDSRDG